MHLELAKTLRNYDRKNLSKDILTGLIIMAVSIPISMGYAQIAGLPAVYGLYGSVFPIILFGLFSTSPQFIFGVETTLGDVREEIARAELAKENPIPTGMSKADYAEMRFEDALVEDDDFDLLVMGRTQGKGCYCYVNGLLQTQLAKYQNNYPYIVVDNEAGMEHISRGVLPSMQTAILVSDCSRRGVQAVGRIAELIKECDMHPDTVGLIINRAPKGELNKGIQEEIANQGLTLLGVVPQDETVYEYDSEGRPTSTLPEDNPVKTALRAIVDNLKL